jgi:pyrimidine-nucleoside phosphorylase
MKIYSPVEVIKRKRNGHVLTKEEIHYFITNFLNGDIPEYQVSALLMAIHFKGLDDEETMAFTKELIDSGEIVDLSHINKPKIDKHSTGGVGDKTSIILAPLVSCFDIVVPMMSGRGLGHTGGTLDKLESIPGFNVNLSTEEFISILEKYNVCMIGQTATLTPGDKRLYEMRDVTATVENIGLITASITSKKIAEGADGIVYDVKVGTGSTLPTLEESKKLAGSLINATKQFNKKAIAILTDMNEPLGYAIGNWNEIEECVTIMNPKLKTNPLSDDLIVVTLTLAGGMLMLGGKCRTIEEGISLSKQKIESGECFDKFINMVEAQGGDSSYFKTLRPYPGAKVREEITIESDGYVSKLDALQFGLAAVNLGCGRKKVDDKVDYSAGIILLKKIGDKVKKGDILCLLFGESDEKINHALEYLRTGIEISATHITKNTKIIEVIA